MQFRHVLGVLGCLSLLPEHCAGKRGAEAEDGSGGALKDTQNMQFCVCVCCSSPLPSLVAVLSDGLFGAVLSCSRSWGCELVSLLSPAQVSERFFLSDRFLLGKPGVAAEQRVIPPPPPSHR